MNPISTLLAPIERPATTPHEFEFQEVCAALEPIYGKVIWVLPTRTYATPFKITKAHEIAVKRGKLTFAYLSGIVKKL